MGKTALGYTLSTLEWARVPDTIPHLVAWLHLPTGLRVIETDAPVEHEDDGRMWYHVSCSYQGGVPNYDDLLRVKRAFCTHQTALQIFPPAEKHISGEDIGPLGNPHVLHLWICLDDLGLPDFGKHGHI